ncbi:Tctex1 domain-containing protein 1 [Holothuria leucospilota]|uniref:Tctex1 domain-containing protein 1 n=1 Tax=Holothuria leucospilota TaxID=206669 RepID=A0A9Q1H853_HOLLE|nr:Tctex1 domain-containing protein 1 [Holothuria leucospilota]
MAAVEIAEAPDPRLPSDNSMISTIPEGSSSRPDTDSRASTEFEPSYQLEPVKKPRHSDIQRLAENELERYLKDLRYDPIKCRQLTRDIASAILERVKEMKVPRYKFVVMVSLGSEKGNPGVQLGSRCLWNDSTDSSITVHFQNRNLFAVAIIYGLYKE